jgi:hypothetical protein
VGRSVPRFDLEGSLRKVDGAGGVPGLKPSIRQTDETTRRFGYDLDGPLKCFDCPLNLSPIHEFDAQAVKAGREVWELATEALENPIPIVEVAPFKGHDRQVMKCPRFMG